MFINTSLNEDTVLLHKIHKIFLKRKTKFSQFSSITHFCMFGTFIYYGTITHNYSFHFIPLLILRTQCRYKITFYHHYLQVSCKKIKKRSHMANFQRLKNNFWMMHSPRAFEETLLCDMLSTLKGTLQIARKLVSSAAPFQVYGMEGY